MANDEARARALAEAALVGLHVPRVGSGKCRAWQFAFVVALFAGVIAPATLWVLAFGREMNCSRAHVMAGLITGSVQAFVSKHGRLPTSADEVRAAGYFDAASADDPWGRPWLIEPTGPGFVVRSLGEDGRARTADDIVRVR